MYAALLSERNHQLLPLLHAHSMFVVPRGIFASRCITICRHHIGSNNATMSGLVSGGHVDVALYLAQYAPVPLADFSMATVDSGFFEENAV